MKYYIAATILAVVAQSQVTVVREVSSEVFAENVPFNISYVIDN
jgi:hypothetical protein